MPTDQNEFISKLEDAKLGVAEDLGLIIGLLTGTLTYLVLYNWWTPVISAPIAYYIVIYRYRRLAEIAEDKYFREAGLGKYFIDKKVNLDDSVDS